MTGCLYQDLVSSPLESNVHIDHRHRGGATTTTTTNANAHTTTTTTTDDDVGGGFGGGVGGGVGGGGVGGFGAALARARADPRLARASHVAVVITKPPEVWVWLVMTCRIRIGRLNN